MKKYKVSVEKTLYCTGIVEVNAKDVDAAIKKVTKKINKGTLQTTDVEWGDLEYQDNSFQTTGDVD